jgi:hypothetical protein
MFSCYRAARLTIDRLERPLVLIERIKLLGHFLICRHCCTHDRQIRGLASLLQMKQDATQNQNPSKEAVSGDSGLSDTARSRIAAVLSSRFTTL